VSGKLTKKKAWRKRNFVGFQKGDIKPEFGHKAYHTRNYNWNVVGCPYCEAVHIGVFLPDDKIGRLSRDEDFFKLWERVCVSLSIGRLSLCNESQWSEENYVCPDCDERLQKE